MYDTTLTSALTTISPSLVSLFTLTKLPLACESFYIPRVSHVKSCRAGHNSKPNASKHPPQ